MRTVQITYSGCPAWLRYHIEAALKLSSDCENPRQVMCNYLEPIARLAAYRLTEEDGTLMLETNRGRMLAIIHVEVTE